MGTDDPDAIVWRRSDGWEVVVIEGEASAMAPGAERRTYAFTGSDAADKAKARVDADHPLSAEVDREP